HGTEGARPGVRSVLGRDRATEMGWPRRNRSRPGLGSLLHHHDHRRGAIAKTPGARAVITISRGVRSDRRRRALLAASFLSVVGWTSVPSRCASDTIQYGLADGLQSGGAPCAILEDRNGLLWIGGPNGFSQYDGRQFSNVDV